MSTAPSDTRRARTLSHGLVVSTVLAIASGLLAAFSPSASAAPPPPALKVSVANVSVPRYSDHLTFSVTSTGLDPSAVVVHHGTQLAFQPSLNSDNTFSIPTLDRFKPGIEHTLVIQASAEAGTEIASGSTSLKFTPWSIGSRVEIAATSIPYTAPVYGTLTATAPTPVKPTGGQMELRYEGLQRATYPIRTDGTFALRPDTLTPGTYPDVTVGYLGDEAYSRNYPNSGLVVTDLTITKVPTTTTAALTDGDVGPQDGLDVVASVASAHPETTADVAGELVVSAAPVGSQDFTEIVRRDYPGGKVAVEVPLDDFVASHTGAWTIRTAYSGSGVADASVGTDRTLTIRATGETVTTTSLELSAATTTAYGAAVTATARVAATDDSDPTGVVILQAGAEQRRVPVGEDGVASATFEAGAAGTRQVTATYAGGPHWAASQSVPATLTVARATTRTAVAAPAGDSVAVSVTAPGSAAVPSGGLRVTESGRQLAAAALAGGRGTFRLPALAPGTHTLQVEYDGDSDTLASSGTLVVKVPPVASSTKAVGKLLRGRQARVTVTVAGSRPAAGRVQVRDGRRLVATGVLKAGRTVLRTKRLSRGKHVLRVQFLGSASLLPSSTVVRIRVR